MHTFLIKSLILSLVLLLSCSLLACSSETRRESSVHMLENRVRAPEFPEGLDWLNTTEPLKLADLRGKIVILDFWTYCCINCHHVMVDLKRLEAKYPDELVVIGVHSAKFTSEKDSENIRQAVLRHQLEHPVVNDKHMAIWQSYGVRAWPTLVLIDPEGYAVGFRSGEGVYEVFDQALQQLITLHSEKGTLQPDKEITAIQPMDLSEPERLLSFPHKIEVDEKKQRLFIADTNNDRIVVVDLKSNQILDFIGSGETGRKDGGYSTAQFDKPTGLWLEGEQLYVADTENHLIRRVSLTMKSVQTIAGTGYQSRERNREGDSLQVALNSPWDVLVHQGVLYIANAGSHQLYRMDLESGHLEPHAGSGRENRVDATISKAQLAQPSGLTTDGEKLYFADSEVSAIRSAPLGKNGSVRTLAGGELFEYGLVDAVGLDARFQHPLGVAYSNGKVYVADTYNNVIRAVTVADNSVSTVFGSGEDGMVDGSALEASFDEPKGIEIAGDTLYIADTNNHIIRTANLSTGEVNTIKLRMPLALSAAATMELFGSVNEEITLSSAAAGNSISLNISLPDGTKLNPLAESLLVIRADGQEDRTVPIESQKTMIEIPKGKFTLGMIIYYCDADNEGLCYVKSTAAQVRYTDDGANSIELAIED